jgi:hypothetical protein
MVRLHSGVLLAATIAALAAPSCASDPEAPPSVEPVDAAPVNDEPDAAADATAAVDAAPLREACNDGVEDDDETGIDCGGSCAPAKRCTPGLGCKSPSDCLSVVCTAGTCAASTCSDGVQNGDETGVDCGGPCLPSKKCASGTGCKIAADCQSNICGAGATCASSCASPSECAPGDTCVQTACVAAPPSCKAILASYPAAVTGDYRIDPDGAGSGAALTVHCDMTTGGGGWTALPLRFDDASLWSATVGGDACVTLGSRTNQGVFQQYLSSNAAGFARTALRFVPPMSVAEVRLVGFNHSPSGACNSMDFMIGAEASVASVEGWQFTDANPTTIRGFVFGTGAQCTAPYVASGGYCSRDTNLGAALFPYDGAVVYSAPASAFQMVLVQGCQSGVCAAPSDGERFYVDVPPDGDGVWRKGIFVR